MCETVDMITSISEEQHKDARDSLALYEEQLQDVGVMRNADAFDLHYEGIFVSL